METTTIVVLAGIGFSGLLSVGWAIGTYNSLQAGKQNMKTMFSNIKTEYQRRWDLLMNLSESVKSYKNHERKTLKEVIAERNKINFTGILGVDMKKLGAFDQLFSKLAFLQEKYPELKANEQHNKLMDEVRITEDRVNIARTNFNDVVRDYNLDVKTFPSSIIANIFTFKEETFYINESQTDKAYKLALE